MQSAHSRLLLGACLYLLIVQTALVEARRYSRSREEVPPPDPVQEQRAGEPTAVREDRELSKTAEEETLRGKTIDVREVVESSDENERKKKSYCSESKPVEFEREESDVAHHGAYARSVDSSDDGYGKYPAAPGHPSQYGRYQIPHPGYDRKEEYGGPQQAYGGDKGQPSPSYYKPQAEEPEYYHAAPPPMYHQNPYQQHAASEYQGVVAHPPSYSSAPQHMPAYGGHQVEHGSLSASYLAHSSGSYGPSGYGSYSPAASHSPVPYSPPAPYSPPPAYGAPAPYKPAMSYPSHTSYGPAYGTHAFTSYTPAISYAPAISYVPTGYHASAPVYHGVPYSYHLAASSYHGALYPASHPAYQAPSYPVLHPSYHGPAGYHGPSPSYGPLYLAPAHSYHGASPYHGAPSYHGAPAPYGGPAPSYHGMPSSYHEPPPPYHPVGYLPYDSHPSMPPYGGSPYHPTPYAVPSYGKPLPYGVPHTPVYLTCSLNPSAPKTEPSPPPSYYPPPYFRAAAEESADEANSQQPAMDTQRGNNKTEEASRPNEQQIAQQPQEEQRKEEMKARHIEVLNEQRDTTIGLNRRQRMPFSLLRQRQLQSQINAKPVFYAREQPMAE